jgi:protein TonB
MFANLATALPSGAAVTLTLLFIMHSLIAMQPVVIEESGTPMSIDWIQQDFPEDLNTEDFVKPELPEVQHPPVQALNREPVDPGNPIRFARTPAIPGGFGGVLRNPFTSDGPLMAIVRVRPVYPSNAASRGIEGHVLVQFDVLANGTVNNVTVIESSNSIFERAAINAAYKFRFKARVIDGEPQTSSGVQYQFRFEMEN